MEAAASRTELATLEVQIRELRASLSSAIEDIRSLQHVVSALEKSSTQAHSVYLFAACAALNSANLGFDIGVSSDVGLEVQKTMDLTDVQTEVFMGFINLVGIVGSLLSSFLSDWVGRRRAFAIAAVGFEIGILVMAISQTYGVLMLGRGLVGLGVGFGLAVDPVYIAEIAPPGQRGRLVTWSEIATNIGILSGFVCGFSFSGFDRSVGWRLMLGMGGVLPLVMLMLVFFFMPESPRWLIQKNRLDEARYVLERLGEADADAAVHRIQNALREEMTASRSVGWRAIARPAPALRRMLLVGIGVAVSQQLAGIDGIQYFLIYILKESGLKDRDSRFGWLVALGALKLFCILVAGFVFDRNGRKPMLYLSCTGMAIALGLLSLNFFIAHGEEGGSVPGLAITALAIYLSFFSFGMGPGAWLIPSEVFSQKVRAKAMSVATFSNRVVATVMSTTFLSMASALSYAGVCLLLALFNVAIIGFLFAVVPETKGRPLEEMLAYFCQIAQDNKSLLELANSSSGPHVEVVNNGPTTEGNDVPSDMPDSTEKVVHQRA